MGARNNDVEQAGNSWGEKQTFFGALAKEGTGIDHLTDKQKNYLYVANIMRNPEILSSAANFFIEVAEQYKEAPLLQDATAEVRHAWPDINIENEQLVGEKNSAERGMTSVVSTKAKEIYEGIARLFNGGEKVTVAKGLEATKNAIIELGLQNKDEYSLEEASFILRATLQLRDVFYNCKPIKSEATAFAETQNRPTRIIGSEAESRGNNFTYRWDSVYEKAGTAEAYRKNGGSLMGMKKPEGN